MRRRWPEGQGIANVVAGGPRVVLPSAPWSAHRSRPTLGAMTDPPAAAASSASAWLDRFFASYYAHRPVNATFIGVHDHDHRLPDLSESGAGDVVADMEALLEEAARIGATGGADGADPTDASREPGAGAGIEEVDLSLARGFLRIQLAEHASTHFWRGNPSTYTGEAVFGVMSLFLTDFAPLADRAEAAIARLDAVPGLLVQGRANVRRAPSTWTQRARRECTGALAFLNEGVDLLGAGIPALAPRLRAAADRAAAAFSDFAAWLDADAGGYPADQVACGEEMLEGYIRDGHFLDDDPDSILAYAQERLKEAEARLREGAATFGAATPGEALAGLAALHAPAEGYYDRYREIWEEVRTLAEERDLLTWPDVPIRYVPRPAWARGAAPHLYFLFYRSPAAFHRPAVHDYLVTPIEAEAPAAERRALLEANNDAVIRLNHVVHHGAIGHHVQNWHAFRAPSRIGRVAAVDCASRIAMFAGGTMAEGWACYATDLVREVGGLTPLEAYAEVQSRVRMCARAVVDVSLHTGRMGLDGARRLYEEVAGMSPAAARAEATKNSMFPGTALMYLMGTDGIHALRRDVETREGAAFGLKRFHDRLLACGSIPVAMAGKLVLGEEEEATRAG